MSKKGPILLAFLLSLPSTLALDFKIISGPIEDLGRFLIELFANRYAVYVIIFLTVFVLLFNIFKAVLSKGPLSDKSKQISATLSLLGTIGISAGGYFMNWDKLISSLVIKNPIFPALLVAGILLLALHKKIGWGWSILIAAVALLLLGGAMDNRQMTAAAFICFAIFLFAKFHKKGGPRHTSSFVRDARSNLRERRRRNQRLRGEEREEEHDIAEVEDLEESERDEEHKLHKHIHKVADSFRRLKKTIKKQLQDIDGAHTFIPEVAIFIRKINDSCSAAIDDLNTLGENVDKELKKLKDALNTEDEEIREEDAERLSEEEELTKKRKEKVNGLIESNLAQDKKINRVEGLMYQFLKNLGKVQEWEKIIQDSSDPGRIHDILLELIRVNYNLDRELTKIEHGVKSIKNELKKQEKTSKQIKDEIKEAEEESD